MVNLDMECNNCGNMIFLSVRLEEYLEYTRGKKVQDAFLSLNTTEREYLISGLCEKCQDEVFGNG